MKRIIYLIFVFSLVSLVIAVPNPRLGEVIDNPELILNLASCYEAEMDDGIGLTREEYFQKYLGLNEISEDCYGFLIIMETIYEEQLEVESEIILEEILDSDGDKFNDEEEIASGTDINDPNDFPWWIDVDGDGFTNEEELFENVDPLDNSIFPQYVQENEGISYWKVFFAIALIVLLVVLFVIYLVYYKEIK